MSKKRRILRRFLRVAPRYCRHPQSEYIWHSLWFMRCSRINLPLCGRFATPGFPVYPVIHHRICLFQCKNLAACAATDFCAVHARAKMDFDFILLRRTLRGFYAPLMSLSTVCTAQREVSVEPFNMIISVLDFGSDYGIILIMGNMRACGGLYKHYEQSDKD